mmetsp:Transcript_102083/g.319022  ORF Transcript_102083/g.319022 Transcript_102083/m.319022 type:complete len:499 (+) Transcript_102083:88-1584(+)
MRRMIASATAITKRRLPVACRTTSSVPWWPLAPLSSPGAGTSAGGVGTTSSSEGAASSLQAESPGTGTPGAPAPAASSGAAAVPLATPLSPPHGWLPPGNPEGSAAAAAAAACTTEAWPPVTSARRASVAARSSPSTRAKTAGERRSRRAHQFRGKVIASVRSSPIALCSGVPVSVSATSSGQAASLASSTEGQCRRSPSSFSVLFSAMDSAGSSTVTAAEAMHGEPSDVPPPATTTPGGREGRLAPLAGAASAPQAESMAFIISHAHAATEPSGPEVVATASSRVPTFSRVNTVCTPCSRLNDSRTGQATPLERSTRHSPTTSLRMAPVPPESSPTSIRSRRSAAECRASRGPWSWSSRSSGRAATGSPVRTSTDTSLCSCSLVSMATGTISVVLGVFVLGDFVLGDLGCGPPTSAATLRGVGSSGLSCSSFGPAARCGACPVRGGGGGGGGSRLPPAVALSLFGGGTRRGALAAAPPLWLGNHGRRSTGSEPAAMP